jgi:hypothetical protein
MCVVIDTCCLALVFDGESKQHAKFAPVLNWINYKGRMVYGGSKYNAELKKARKFLPFIAELSRRSKTVQIPDGVADPIAAALKAKIADDEFDDEQLAALVVAARCCVVCTNDKTAIKYLKRTDLFSGYAGLKRPKFFQGHASHKALCCDENVVGKCKGEG